MNPKKLAVCGAMTAALLTPTVVGVAAAAATTAAPTATCLPADHDGAWPAAATGRPARDPGVRVWHDRAGWHVRVTHSQLHDRVFAGVIRTSGELVGVRAVRLEKNDALVVGPNRHELRFRFNNYGGTDGFDFFTHCAPYLGNEFVSDGHIVAPVHISIGADAHHPRSDPFRIARTA